MEPTSRLIGKTIVIIGGAGLIGSSSARRILEERGVAILADRDIERGKLLAKELSAKHPNGTAVFLSVDSCDGNSVRKLIQDAQSVTGRIDALVNAGYPRGPQYGARLEDVTYETFCANVSMQLGSSFVTSQQFALFFKGQGHGNIVNFSSIYGVVAPRFDIYESSSMTMPVEYAVVKSGLRFI